MNEKRSWWRRASVLVGLLVVATSAGAQEVPTEQALLADFGKAFKADEAGQRAAALIALGELSLALPDGGSSRNLAKALVKGLSDKDLDVQTAAVEQLSWGRHVDTTIKALGASLEDQVAEISRQGSRPDDYPDGWLGRAAALWTETCAALGHYPDDRAVDAFVKHARHVTPGAGASGSATVRVMSDAVADALLQLGSHKAVEEVIKALQNYFLPNQASDARRLHDRLAAFAERVGLPPSPWAEPHDQAAQRWMAWLDEHGKQLPKKLGKLKEAPRQPANADG